MGKKNYSYKYLFLRLSWYLKEDKKKVWFLLFLVIAETGFLTLAPLFVRDITDCLKESVAQGAGVDFTYIIQRLCILSVFYILGSLFGWLDNCVCVELSQRIIRGLRDKAQKKINRLPLDYIDTHPAGDILSRVTNDMVTLSNTLDSTIMKLISQALTILGVVAVMIYMDPVLSVIFVLMVPLSYFVMTKITGITKPLFKRQQKSVGALNGLMNDIYSNHALMEAFSYEERATVEFEQLNEEFFSTYVKSRFFSGFIFPVSKLINNLAYIALCILSAVLMIAGKLTLGELQAFLIYANMIAGPIGSFSSSLNNAQMGMAAAERVLEFLDLPEETKDSVKDQVETEQIQGMVEFEHVRFGYVPDKVLMQDVSFRAAPGMTMAIVGPSGAGKTTLVNLLLRFYEIQGGTIRLDGHDTRRLSKENLRSVFGMVLQDTWIFDGTAADNIGYGRPEATRGEIIEAAQAVRCDTFIEKLPDGYDTHISNEDSVLSSGEKQLITIARTVLADPKILILDEATSQVDTKTEALITAAMEKMMEGRTCFVIAHRLFTIRSADAIIFMKDGDIKEVGTHAELMQRRGYYASMYNSASDEG